jgi:DNA-binding NarL/FixJ family response regulator
MIRILLVDDQAIVRTGLRTLLEVEPDLEVVGEAGEGRSAVRRVAELVPDVVLMDIRMPDMDGIEATTAIVSAGSPTRVCVLTTYNVDEYVFDALAAGASGFLLKTDTPERIVATVRAVAEGEFALGADATATLVARYLRGARPPTDGQDPLAALTPREREVFTLVARGLTNAEIAGLLFVGEGTVKTHVARILYKLGLRDRLQVVVFAHGSGLAG